MDKRLLRVEDQVLLGLAGKFNEIVYDDERFDIVRDSAKTIESSLTESEIEEIFKDMNDMGIVGKLIYDQEIEDVMVNNVNNIFVNNSKLGNLKLTEKIPNREE